MADESKYGFRELFKAVYFAIALATIIVFIPNEGRFKYEFQKGKPWMHEDLFSPFDFPIYKSEQEVFAEKAKILKEFKAFFRLDSTIEQLIASKFNDDFTPAFERFLIENTNIPPKNKAAYQQAAKQIKQEVTDALHLVYDKGIINQAESSISSSMLNKGLSVITGNVATDRWYEDVFTTQKATAFISKVANEFTNRVSPVLNDFWKKFNLKDYIHPNLIYDDYTTQKFKNELISNISLTKGMVQAGERIISNGEIIDSDTYQVLLSLKTEYEKRLGSKNRFTVTMGNILLLSSLFLVLYLFLLNFRPEVLRENSKLLFILMLITLMAIVSILVIRSNTISIFIIPLVIVPIFIKTFFDSRLALFVHLVTIFIVAFLVPNSFEFVFTNFIAGIVAILSLTNMYRRGKLFKTVGLVYLTYLSLYLSLSIVENGSLKGVNWLVTLWYGINALLLLASYQLVYIFEKIFGFLSDISLIELSDTNLDLLRKLAEVAPGTFQHSLQVANLAESAVQRVGGNPLLVRTGALYHDIGKMSNPLYFIENQQSGFNPHDNIDNAKSAEIIINHVAEGVKIALKAGLPRQIVDFITMHHGTSKVRYFYNKQILVGSSAEIDENKFTYPGPEPQSKETAIVMMADAVEAASRSLKEYSVQSIDELVERIINEQLSSGQFKDAEITFKDINTIKTIFKKKLQNIYHVRVEYPESIKKNH